MADAILGISAFYHDSAAALLLDGEIIAAAHEERFTRKKHDERFPANAVQYVLDEAGLTPGDLKAVAFYDKPYLKFERLLETYHAFAPKGLASFILSMPVWIKEKLFMKKTLRDELEAIGPGRPPFLFPEHHLSHVASAFYPSPFEEAAVLTIDGVGEWATTTIATGAGNRIALHRQLDFPHSLGLLYSAFTYYTGFKVNSGEYKLMGLAPYGDPTAGRTKEWKQLILDELIDVREDGSLLLNMEYFDFATGLTMCCDRKWERLFGVPRREAESDITQPYMDMALAIQQVTEDVVLQMARAARDITGKANLVMAGGVALNCVANGKLIREKIFDRVWIQPAAGDAGGALGAALAAHYISFGHERIVPEQSGPRPQDMMEGSYLGPVYGEGDILRTIRRHSAPHQRFDCFDSLCDTVAEKLSQGAAVGWFQGRMEWGPRALGNRSILGDPRDPETQKKLNLKIKYREGFRPFAPSVLAEDADEYFQLDGDDSPYMLVVAPVRERHRQPVPENYASMEMYERLYHQRSDIPAITHVDYSARIQTVHKETNPRYHAVISAFKKRTGCGLVVNTSFNVRGEPIVCTPEDAYRCFMRTEMDYLVLGDFLFVKADQPPFKDAGDWRNEYELD
ncbi:carbamoyltransferase family protein [Megalodesulfovibrio gigas]|uniref:Putative Carbamoyltransferase n=1 Tax=Megalodesulfovibrio gigas (strain ATCC 19364 / DSM 1382 / NCIMB 9332 / VKM B-1759) TaxID=1121448 RepID=T2GBS3_MEGG1|nr:carbamoyltransferase [Megalodesulfovibrio gigas]AGW13556.1 putative Carbamoyltransferase [Megalodesulfovibrio gigas DSM 1382 = ATCC 19364]